MKHILITTSILFAFSGAFAQVKGTKNIKPLKAPSTVRPMSSDVESSSKSKNVTSVKGQSSSTATSKTSIIRPQKSAAGNSTRSSSSRINNNNTEKYSPSALNGEPTSTKNPISKPNKGSGEVFDVEEKEKGKSLNNNELRSSGMRTSSSSVQSSKGSIKYAPAALVGEPTPTKNPVSKPTKGKGSDDNIEENKEKGESSNGLRSSRSSRISEQSSKGSDKEIPTAIKGEPTSTKNPISKPNKGKGDKGEGEEENKEKGEK